MHSSLNKTLQHAPILMNIPVRDKECCESMIQVFTGQSNNFVHTLIVKFHYNYYSRFGNILFMLQTIKYLQILYYKTRKIRFSM